MDDARELTGRVMAEPGASISASRIVGPVITGADSRRLILGDHSMVRISS